MTNHYHWKSSRSCRNKCNNPYCYKHLPRDHPSKITTKISKLLLHATKEFPNALIYFSAILPKFNNTFFEMINHVNSEIFELCSYYHQLRFIQHQDFAKNHAMNKELFWKDMIHTNINGLRQLARDFIKHERFLKFLKLLFKLIFFHMHKESFWKFSLDGLGKIWIEFLFLCCLLIHDFLLYSLLILFL